MADQARNKTTVELVTCTSPHNARTLQIAKAICEEYNMPPGPEQLKSVTYDIALFAIANWKLLEKQFHKDVAVALDKGMEPPVLWNAAINAQLSKAK